MYVYIYIHIYIYIYIYRYVYVYIYIYRWSERGERYTYIKPIARESERGSQAGRQETEKERDRGVRERGRESRKVGS